MAHPSNIILIGPPFSGKSTLGKLLAQKLDRPNISFDEIRWHYFKEIGYDEDLAACLRQKGGFLSLVAYWSQFNAYGIERLLQEHQNCVIDLGGGPIVFENSLSSAQIQKALEPFPYVIRLLPSPDLERSVEVLQKRASHLIGTNAQGFNWSRFFVSHKKNQRLAKFEVFTDGKTPEESCADIFNLIRIE